MNHNFLSPSIYFCKIPEPFNKANNIFELISILRELTSKYCNDANSCRDNVKIINSIVSDDACYGEYVLVRNSYICPGVYIGSFCEINDSIVLYNARINHHDYIGHSIIGCSVQIGGNVRTAARRLDNSYPRICINGEIITSPFIKFGSVVGDNAIIGSTVLLNPFTILNKYCCILPFQSIGGYHAR